MSDEALTVYARNREALCLYAWHPYMYNPQLPRWLGRIKVPTLLLWGESDRVVTPDYGRAYSRLIPGSRFELIEARRAPSGNRAARGLCRAGCPFSRGVAAMQAWYHCENVYPFVPQEVLDRADSVRASLPNKYCDPKIAADLFEECLDEHLLCDDLGVNVVSIEHHSGINSLYGASPMILGILARQTKKVRILSLGTLITVRPDPVRVAEEYATADVISRGRLEIGFVKSGDSEMVSGNANPVGYVERFWEAIDLIQKTLTSHDGPFSWEGKHFTHRHVNIWPPVYQRPHPPMWAATGDPRPRPSSAGAAWSTRWYCAARRPASAPSMPTARRAREAGLPAPGTDRFAYAALRAMSATPTRRVCGSAANCCGSSTPASSSRPKCRSFCPAACRPRCRRRTTDRDRGPALQAVAPGRRPDRHHAEQAIARGILCAGNPGHGLQADHGHLRQGRRVRATSSLSAVRAFSTIRRPRKASA